jgi:sec-independent protein translocase protein TatA
MRLQGWEWVIILAIVLLLWGAPKLPALARSMAQSMQIFRKELKGVDKADKGSEPAAPAAETAEDSEKKQD